MLDQKEILENPYLIITDTVRLACDQLWRTIKEKVIFKYNLTCAQMKFVLNWIHSNLSSLL
jgi:hypothetical protein